MSLVENINPDAGGSSQSSSGFLAKAGNAMTKVSGVASPALDMAGGIIGGIDKLFGISQKRQYRMQKNLMDKQQNQWKEQQEILAQEALDQWNRENEYNDPSNAYKRLLEGAEANGLSKAAVMGDQVGGVSGQLSSNAKSQGSTSVPHSGGVGMQSLGGVIGLMGLKKAQAEINLIEAQAKEANQNAELLDAKVTTENLNWSIQNNQSRLYEIQYKSEQSTIKWRDTMREIEEINKRTLHESNIADIQYKFAQAYNQIKQAELTDSEKAVNWQRVRTLEAEMALKYAYSKLASAQATGQGLKNKLIDQNYSELVLGITSWADTMSWQAEGAQANAMIAQYNEQAWWLDKSIGSFGQLVQAFTGALTMSKLPSGAPISPTPPAGGKPWFTSSTY